MTSTFFDLVSLQLAIGKTNRIHIGIPILLKDDRNNRVVVRLKADIKQLSNILCLWSNLQKAFFGYFWSTRGGWQHRGEKRRLGCEGRDHYATIDIRSIYLCQQFDKGIVILFEVDMELLRSAVD